MNLRNFVEQYPDEASCKLKWKFYRDKVSVVCPRCGYGDHYWKTDKDCLNVNIVNIVSV